MEKDTVNQTGIAAGKTFTVPERDWVFGLAFALILISWASIKMVLPALPKLPNILQCTPGGVKLSVSLYLIFFACSQPIWGGIVQNSGCRRTLFFSLFITTTGTLTVLFSFNLPLYIIGRSLEGLGMGAASTLCRTMIADVFDRKELVGKLGLLISCAAAMPAIAPIFGGYLMLWISWRAIFGSFLLFIGVFFYLAFRKLPETHLNPADKTGTSLPRLLKIYLSILKNSRFWGFALPYAFLTGGLIGYYSAMPFWYHSQLGIKTHLFSYLALPTVGMYISGINCARFMVKKKELEEVFIRGILLAAATTGAAGLLSLLKVSGAASIAVILSGYAFAGGMVSPTANAGVLSKFKNVAGPAAALVALVVFGSASITSGITMNLYIKNTLWPVTGYIGILSLIGLAAGYLFVWVPYTAGRCLR